MHLIEWCSGRRCHWRQPNARVEKGFRSRHCQWSCSVAGHKLHCLDILAQNYHQISQKDPHQTHRRWIDDLRPVVEYVGPGNTETELQRALYYDVNVDLVVRP